jgi:hypothetical protein
VLENGRVSYIEKRAAGDPVTPFGPSATLPAHATAIGKALLAFAPREVVVAATQLTAYTPHTLHTVDRLQRALGIVRLTRSAVARGELVLGESAVAVPVFGCAGEVIAALELELHDPRADLELCRAALAVAARGLSRELAVDHDRVERPRLRLLSRRTAPPHRCRRRDHDRPVDPTRPQQEKGCLSWPAGMPRIFAVTGGTALLICARSGTVRVLRRWVSMRRIIGVSR